MFKSAEKIDTEILLLSRRSRLRLLLLRLLLLLGFFLLLGLLLLFGGGGGSSAHGDLLESLADDLNKRGDTSSTVLPLREARTALTWASSTGLPAALRMAMIESLSG
jgi:hypothetical protein